MRLRRPDLLAVDDVIVAIESISTKEMPSCGLPSVAVRTRQNM